MIELHMYVPVFEDRFVHCPKCENNGKACNRCTWPKQAGWSHPTRYSEKWTGWKNL